MPDLKTFEEQKAFTQRLNLMDDRFFHKVAEDREACEELLQILLEKPDLKIVETQPQRHLRNVANRSVILDVLCQDDTGSLFNIEVQKANRQKKEQLSEEYQKRVRFNLANLDTLSAETGIAFHQLPDIYSVFISELDPFQKNRTTYHIHRAITETGDIVENGVHEIYINTTADDGSEHAELMHYFVDSNGYHPKFQKISKRVEQFKHTNKGVTEMASVFDEYADERDKETATNLLRNGVSVELIVKSMPSLSEEEILKLKDSLALQTAI